MSEHFPWKKGIVFWLVVFSEDLFAFRSLFAQFNRFQMICFVLSCKNVLLVNDLLAYVGFAAIPEFDLCFEPLRFYLYIGITSSCLYNSIWKSILQYGILYKLNKEGLFKMQNIAIITKNALTKGNRL